MVVQYLLSSLAAGAVAGVASLVLPLPLAVALGLLVGPGVGLLVQARKHGKRFPLALAIGQGLVAGTTAFLVFWYFKG